MFSSHENYLLSVGNGDSYGFNSLNELKSNFLAIRKNRFLRTKNLFDIHLTKLKVFLSSLEFHQFHQADPFLTVQSP